MISLFKNIIKINRRHSYSKRILDHYENPRNVRSIQNNNNVGIGIVGSLHVVIYETFYEVDRKSNKITDAKFKTFGCGSAIASSSLTTELIKGKT